MPQSLTPDHVVSTIAQDSRNMIRRRKGDRLLAFLQADKGLRAPQLFDRTGPRTSGLHCSYPGLLLANNRERSLLSSYETEGASRESTASSRGSRGRIACSPHTVHCHAMPCNMQHANAVPREAKRAYSSRMQIGHICHVDMCIRCRPVREISQASRTRHGMT